MPGIKARLSELLSTAKAGNPIPNLDRSVAAETLWPTSLEKESDKAAGILRAFFVDGFIVPYRTLATCPQEVFRKCQGVAVFHLLRDGLRSSIASGSGVVTMRLPDGKWSDAAGILVNYDANLPPEVDVVDVVLVFRDKHSMAMLSSPKRSEWEPVTAIPAPVPSAPGAPDQAPTTTQSKALIWSYVKSKGHLLGELELQNLSIREFTKENEQCYGVSGVNMQEILTGKAKAPSGVFNYLANTLRAIDKERDDYSHLPAAGKCPSDRRVKPPSTSND